MHENNNNMNVGGFLHLGSFSCTAFSYCMNSLYMYVAVKSAKGFQLTCQVELPTCGKYLPLGHRTCHLKLRTHF